MHVAECMSQATQSSVTTQGTVGTDRLFLHISGLGGRLCDALTKSSTSCIEVKKQIERKARIPVREQRLLFGTSEIRDGDVLCNALAGADWDFPLNVTLIRRRPKAAAWLAKTKHKPSKLMRAPCEVLADKEVMLEAVRKDGFFFGLAADELRSNYELFAIAVQQDGLALAHASKELRATREVVMTAVKQTGCALAFAASHLKADHELVLTAVRQDGRSLEFASIDLQDDHEVVLTAVKESSMALRYASENLRANPMIALTAIMKDPSAIQFVSPELQQEIKARMYLTWDQELDFFDDYGLQLDDINREALLNL